MEASDATTLENPGTRVIRQPGSANDQTARPEQPPEAAQCLQCGYLLLGLTHAKCPECGREFDPADPRTFDSDPPESRRRRRFKRVGVFISIAAVVLLLCPRGLLRGTLVFTRADCDEQITFARTQLRPPRWIPFSYPGFTSRALTPGKPDRACGPIASFRLQFDLSIGGSAAGSGPVDAVEPTWINGHAATVDTACRVLKTVLAPDNSGVFLGPPQD